MTTQSAFAPWPTNRPEFLAFAPMVYVAWSDCVLTPDEFKTLAELLSAPDWIDDEGRTLLHTWLDADLPPTPDALNSLRDLVRRWWPDDRELLPATLAGLGLELVRGSGLTGGPWSDDDAPGLLSEAEHRLGVSGPEAIRLLLGSR